MAIFLCSQMVLYQVNMFGGKVVLLQSVLAPTWFNILKRMCMHQIEFFVLMDLIIMVKNLIITGMVKTMRIKNLIIMLIIQMAPSLLNLKQAQDLKKDKKPDQI